jgi:hypothetical protein
MKTLALFLLLSSSVCLYADWQRTTTHSSVWQNVQSFGATGNGVTDDTAAIQSAINHNRSTNEWKGPAVVYIPPGTYKISNTIVVWAQTMLVGDENQPPQFVLVSNAPGFNNAAAKKPVFVATGGYNVLPSTEDWWDNSGTFGGVADNTFNVWIQNINLQISSGNPGAVGIFWKVAQFTALRNINITAASDTAIAIDVGGGQNDYSQGFVPQQVGGGVVENVTVNGGVIGIRASNMSQWTFRNITTQSQSSIGVQALQFWGLSFVNLTSSGAPTGLSYAQGSELVILDSNISGTSTAFSTDGSPWYAENTPGITSSRGVETHIVSWIPGWINGTQLSAGTHALSTTRTTAMNLTPKPPIYPGSGTIINVKDPSIGAKGDWYTDDTAALQNAINNYQTVYLPYGTYKISAPLNLRANTRLFGEMPMTEIILAPNSRGFGNANNPHSLIVTPNGSPMICNLTVYASDSTNPGAQLVEWDGTNQNTGIWDMMIFTNGAVDRDFCCFGPGVFSDIYCGGDATQTGILGSSNGPVWFYGVTSEDQPGTAYTISGAGNYFIVTPQIENTPTVLSITGCGNIFSYNLVGGISSASYPLVRFSSDSNLSLVGMYLGGLSEICTNMPSNGSCIEYQGKGLSTPTQISVLQFH